LKTTIPSPALSEAIRKRVSFRKHTLRNDLKPFGQFDLILCRDVAIYLKADFTARLFDRLTAYIQPGGNLLPVGS
jgi:chemotaxis protein methyltransferase CheR